MKPGKRATQFRNRANQAEDDVIELLAEVTALREERDRIKHQHRIELEQLKQDNRHLELAVEKLIHDKIALGQQLMQQRYAIDFLQGKFDIHTTNVFRASRMFRNN